MSSSSASMLAPTALSGPKAPSPLVAKITSVLSKSYSDTEFRDALALLDEREVVNEPETRRQVRLELQKEVIDSNADIIREFGKVSEQLQRIKGTVDKLNSRFETVKRNVAAAQVETQPALREASSLIQQQEQLRKKRMLLDTFTTHFSLSDDEIASLTVTSEPADDNYFAALRKAKKIRADCHVLLGFESQALGLELMDQTSKRIDLGYQKLYKWVQREFKTLNLENPQMNPSIRRSLRVLAEKPTLFRNCIAFFAEARERILTDAFHSALVGPPSRSTGPSAKPIDMVAHDPLRYVGDMLAWIHSAAVSEHEALEVLFVSEGEELARGLKTGRDAEVWRLVADDDDQSADYNALRALEDLIDRDISGAARVLRQRIEQVIQGNEDTIVAYKLANLVGFYRITFEKLLGSASTLVDTMSSLQTEAFRQFKALVREHIATLHGQFQQTPSNLEPPAFLHECLKQLDACMHSYDSSLAIPGDRKSGFDPLLAEAFDPFMSGCENMARSMPKLNASIFLINCYLLALSTLDGFDFTQARANHIHEAMDKVAEDLAGNQLQFLRDASGLDAILDAFLGEAKESNPNIDPVQLREASQSLDDFLPSAWMDSLERVRHLRDSTLARQITQDAAEDFCRQFEQLEAAIEKADKDSMGEREGDQPGPLRLALPRTTAELSVLLS
ncbi:Conserved oligomeric Golgi complex subunit 6 [Emericellopsis cladophorae]|uniref:Conserved oligomeric Golgi complex subunit 6 n=1 Tax=Emericellopsis cladophorae TaxID=2686198 RepID=A0A9P9XY17_9HYPO|nr:Conserved oligomeric Golgi complex subunit 6 [Emericellopsis cladophorae]KAI6779678.1 Conserved oligomeric Golgi complex subunit 6 [Emericellopsis cladophorae]